MERKPEFKTSFLGYEKDAVLNYIDWMSSEAQESEQRLNQKIEQITHSREELEGQIAEFEEKINNVSQDLDSERGKNKKLSDMIGLLQQEIDRQRRTTEGRDREFEQMLERNRQLQAQVASTQEKSRRYDEAASSIGSAILEAQQTAKAIVGAANDKAQKINRDTEQFAQEILGKIELMQRDFLQLRGRMNQSIDLLNSRFDQIEKDILTARELVVKNAEILTEEFMRTQDDDAEQLLPGKPKIQPVNGSKSSDLGRLNLSGEQLQKHRLF